MDHGGQEPCARALSRRKKFSSIHCWIDRIAPNKDLHYATHGTGHDGWNPLATCIRSGTGIFTAARAAVHVQRVVEVPTYGYLSRKLFETLAPRMKRWKWHRRALRRLDHIALPQVLSTCTVYRNPQNTEGATIPVNKINSYSGARTCLANIYPFIIGT